MGFFLSFALPRGTRRIGVFWDLLCESPTQEVLAANMRVEGARLQVGIRTKQNKSNYAMYVLHMPALG